MHLRGFFAGIVALAMIALVGCGDKKKTDPAKKDGGSTTTHRARPYGFAREKAVF